MVDGIKAYQRVILPSTLYAVNAASHLNFSTSSNSSEQLRANIQVATNAADIYGSNILPGAAPTGMTKIMTGLLGIKAFDFVPNYIFVAPTGDNPTAIVLTGVNAVAA